MIDIVRRVLRRLAPVPILPAPQASTPSTVPTDAKRENLMVVVRESVGANKRSEALVPFGRFVAVFSDGRQVTMEMPWWQFIGDLHIRFVFDGENEITNASLQDLKRLGLGDVNEALALSMDNIQRTHGVMSRAVV
jgi:hypothetical protein